MFPPPLFRLPPNVRPPEQVLRHLHSQRRGGSGGQTLSPLSNYIRSFIEKTRFSAEQKTLKRDCGYFLMFFLASMNPHATNTPASAVSGETGE